MYLEVVHSQQLHQKQEILLVLNRLPPRGKEEKENVADSLR